MKKQLVASLAAAMVLGIAGTSFAAANPFVDVPAKHWSYDSVTKLAQAGLVDGYANGQFQGDKTITRYEMAQIVAKAMGKSDKADASQKAALEKLQVEFADELNKIGVRVEALEKNQPNVKFAGQLALRYTSKDDEANADKSTAARYRLRLNATATVDENTTAGFRFANNSFNKTLNGYGLPAGSQWTTFGSQTAGGDSAVMDRAFINSKVGAFNVTAGRQALVVGTTGAIADSGNVSFDGLKVATKIGQVDAVVNHGRLVDQKDLDAVEISTKTGKLAYGVGMFNIKDNAKTPTNTFGKDVLKLQYANASYNFDSNLSLTVEAGKNKADYASSDNKFYNVIAKIGDQALNAKGKQNFVVQYASVGKDALALDAKGAGLTTLDTTITTTKYTAWDLSYNRAFSSNMFAEFHYARVDDKATTAVSNVNDYNYFRVNVVSKF